jgi:hypothetical protein
MIGSRMHRQFVHDAALRGADVDPLELVLRGDLALDVFGDLAADVRKLLAHLGPQVLVDLEHLDLCLGDLAIGLGDGRDQRAAFSRDPGGVAPDADQLAEFDHPLAPQILEPGQLLGQEIDLAVLGDDLLLKPADLLVRLGDAFLQLRFLSLAGGAADPEQPHLPEHRVLHIGFRDARRQVGRERDLLGAVLLGDQTGLARRLVDEGLVDDGKVRARDGLVETHDDVARLDAIAVPDPQLADDAADRVLDFLEAGTDHKRARRHDGPGYPGLDCPGADAGNEEGRQC